MRKLLASLSLLLVACGGGPNLDKEAANRIPEGQRIGTQKAEVISGQPQFSNGVLDGTGTVRFAEHLQEPRSANNFRLALELPEGGSATLITNANRDLTNGIEVEISRPVGSMSPRIVARAGSDTLDLSPLFVAVGVSGAMLLSFDLHNDHGEAVHLVAWNDQGAPEPLGEDQLRGLGSGVFWGLKLSNAKVTYIQLSSPRDVH